MAGSDALDRLMEEMDQPSTVDQWNEGFADALDPDESDLTYSEYATDPVGFCQQVLGLYLTPDQKVFMQTVADARYEIVQVQSATGVGKTFALGAIAIWIYKTMGGSKVYTASAPPESNLKTLLWGEIYKRVEENAALFLRDDVKASIHISRNPQEFITGVTIPMSKSYEQMVTIFSGKHAPVLVFLFDEGDGINDAVFEGADGCLSGGTFIKLIVCYNPKKKEGQAYKNSINGSAKVISMSAFNHPNVLTGDDTIVPGAVTKNKTGQRINDWTEPVRDDDEIDATCFQVPEFFVNYVARTTAGKEYPPIPAGWRKIIDGQFSYKVLGLYPAAGTDQLIRDDWIDKAVAKWVAMRAMNEGEILPPGGIDPTMGLDVAGGGPDSHVAIFNYGGWIEPPIDWKNMDPDRGAEKATRLYYDHEAERCYVDSTGVGAAAPYRMYRYGRSQGWDVEAIVVMVNQKSKGWSEAGDFYIVRDEAYWMLREAFRTGEIMIPPKDFSAACRRLHEALIAMTYEHQGNTIRVVQKKILKKKLGYSPDEADALMLTYCPASVWMGAI